MKLKRVCLFFIQCIAFNLFSGKIKDFLSIFVGPSIGDDVTDGIAEMDIGDDDGNLEAQRMKGLKYMSQLVRVYRKYPCDPL